MYDKLNDGTSLPYYVFDCVCSKLPMKAFVRHVTHAKRECMVVLVGDLQVEYKQMYHANSVSINKVERVLRVTQERGGKAVRAYG
jgi:hypothetical protein